MAPRGIGRASPRHFDCPGVPPQRGRQQKGPAGSGLARRHRRRRQFAVSHRQPAQGARRWQGRRAIHHDLAGRGYCFVAPISRSANGAMYAAFADNFPHANLPSRLTRMVGRDDDVLKALDPADRLALCHIVGAGGVGKTTVAVAVGHHLIEAFAGAVLFVDLGMLSDPKSGGHGRGLHAGLSVQSDDATPSLIAYLRNKRILLDPRYLRTSHRSGGCLWRRASSMPHRKSTSWRQVARRFRSRASTSTDWMRLLVRRTIQGSPRRLLRISRRPSCSWSARWRAALAGLQRRGSRNRGEHLPKARRCGARDRVGRSTR
jgi:hypothetical protein